MCVCVCVCPASDYARYLFACRFLGLAPNLQIPNCQGGRWSLRIWEVNKVPQWFLCSLVSRTMDPGTRKAQIWILFSLLTGWVLRGSLLRMTLSFPCMVVGPLSVRFCNKKKTKEFRSSPLHLTVLCPAGGSFRALYCDILTKCSAPIFNAVGVEAAFIFLFCWGKCKHVFRFFSFNLDSYDVCIFSPRRREKELGQTCAARACHRNPSRDGEPACPLSLWA